MAFQTSASEIANYKGNAAAAIGSADGVGANVLLGDTDASKINERIDAITLANVTKNNAEYERKLKERDALFEKISSKEMQVNQMLPEDRDYVRSKYLAPIRQMLLEDPDLKSKPEKFLRFQELTKDFEEQKVYGQHRFLMLSQLDKEIAAEVDPEKKARMEEHRTKMAKQEMTKEVKPYQQMLDFTDAAFVAVKPTVTPRAKIVGNEEVTETYTHTPVKEFMAGVIRNMIDSPNRSITNQLNSFREWADKLGDEDKATRIQQWNDKIADVMAKEGLTEASPDYIKPIKSKMELGADGKQHLMIDEGTARVALAESLLRNYKNETLSSGKASDLGSKINRNNEAALKDAATRTQLIPAQRAKAYADVGKSNAEREKAQAETREINRKGQGAVATGDYYVNRTLSFMDEKKMEGLAKAEDHKDQYGTIQGYILKATDSKGNVNSVLSPAAQRAFATPYDAKGGGTALEVPATIVFDGSDKKNPVWTTITKVPIKDAFGNNTTKFTKQIDTLTPIDVLERAVKNNIGEFTTGKDEGNTYENAITRLKQRIGIDKQGITPQNVNARIMELLQRPDWLTESGETQTGTAKPKAPAKVVPKKKVDSTLLKESQEQFFK